MERLSELRREAAEGRAGWAVVSGGPGTGKTRLPWKWSGMPRVRLPRGVDPVHRERRGSGAPRWTGNGPAERPARDLRDRAAATRSSPGAVVQVLYVVPVLYVAEDLHRADDGLSGLLTGCARGAGSSVRRRGGNPFLLTESLKLPEHLRTGAHARTPPAVRSVTRVRPAGLTPATRVGSSTSWRPSGTAGHDSCRPAGRHAGP